MNINGLNVKKLRQEFFSGQKIIIKIVPITGNNVNKFGKPEFLSYKINDKSMIKIPIQLKMLRENAIFFNLAVNMYDTDPNKNSKNLPIGIKYDANSG